MLFVFCVFSFGIACLHTIVLLVSCWKLCIVCIARIVLDAFRFGMWWILCSMVQHINACLVFYLGMEPRNLEPLMLLGLQRWAAVWSLAVHYMLCIVMPQFALSGLNVMYCLCSMYCTLLYVLSLRCSILLWPAEVAFSFLSLRIYYIDGLKLRMRARFPKIPFS